MSKPKPMSEERLAEIEALIEYEDVDGMRASGPRLIPDLLTEVRRLRAELAEYRALAERAHELEERRELADYMNADVIVDELAALHKEAADGS